MQPRFPPDHHFHRRRNQPLGADEIAALAETALVYMTRQILPAFDSSDPREHP